MKPQTQQTYRERILKVLVHIQNHLDDALSIDELARLANFSPYHFHRIFSGMVGESVMGHVRRLRLERAAHRLRFTDQPVTPIAFDAGFEAHEAFTRAFRAMFDTSPIEYRKQHRSIDAPRAPSGVHYTPDGSVVSFEPVQTGEPPMSVKIQEIEPMHVAFIRHVGPYMKVGDAWTQLMNWAGPRGLLGPSMTMVGVCHDDPAVTPPDKVRYDACLVVRPDVKAEGDVGIQDIGGGSFAVFRHVGPYEKMAEAYNAICGQWLPTSGREARSAPALEFYRNSPMNTPPEKLMTDVCLPLA